MAEPTFLRLRGEFGVLRRTGLSRSTVYLRMKEGRFPKPVPLDGSAVAWVESEISQWIADRVKAARPETVAA